MHTRHLLRKNFIHVSVPKLNSDMMHNYNSFHATACIKFRYGPNKPVRNSLRSCGKACLNAGMDRRCPPMQAKFDKRAAVCYRVGRKLRPDR